MSEQEKTVEEIQAELEARGDFVEGAEDDDAEVEAAAATDNDDAPEVGDDDEPEVVTADAEEEADAEEVEGDEPGAKADDAIMIPKSRFDEAQSKARQREEALQTRLDAAEQRKTEEAASVSTGELEKELDDLDTKYAELLLEGEVEQANAVRKQWRQKNSEMFDARLEQRSTLASNQAVESMRFDRQLAEYEVKFPVINPDAEGFDEDVAGEVADLMGAFQAKGLNPVAALNKAVKYVIRGEDAPAPVVDKSEDMRNKREATARRKVADLAEKSPPDITGKGRDTDKVGTGDGLPDVTKMSPEQFAELTDTQLRSLREDTITNQETA